MKDKVKKKLLKCMSFTTRKPKPPVERRHSVNMDGHDFSEKDYEPNEATSDSVSNKSKPPSVKRQNSIRLSKKSDSALSTGTSEISTKSRLRAAAKAVNLIGNLHASEPTYFQEPKQAEDPYTVLKTQACDAFGEIDPTEFETVVLGLVQTKDAELWDKRLEEKQRQHDLREAEKAKKEADLIKLEADGDGVISTSDVYNLMMGLGEMLTDDELFGMVNVVDLDCDGKVTFDDFRKFLLPQSGDETLITSPAELAQRLIESTAPVSVAYDTKAENADKDADVVNENVGENADVIPNQNADDINGGGVETELGNGEKEKEETAVTSEAEVVTEKTEEDTKKKADYQRKRSMLWGYTSSSSTDTTTPDTPEVITDDGTLDCANLEKPEVDDDNRLTDPPDTPGQLLLDAIKEEDEHSNYDVERKGDEKEVNDKHEQKPDVKPVLHIEHKKKLFSRQSSSASLKTKFTESFVDSGVETMDSVNCSEMLDLPDEYDIDMSGDETEEAKAASTSHPATKHSARAIYDDNQEDEDMVEAHHVHESLSRVSSTESLSKLEDLESEMPTERVKNFVNEIMRIDLPKSPTSGELNVKLKESDRLTPFCHSTIIDSFKK
ncbi:CML8-like protein [Mya arenaria]|uniref:CML8-like protein n=1 Tax=Mya arenaria TaxID=6604 RepID=A0ABY7F439_MYAAR|nr:CML8-like protein [Mya arenaria]